MSKHLPVLLDEVIQFLDPKPGGRFIDATLGAGGHARAILERTSPDGRMAAIDQDESALASAREMLESFGLAPRFRPRQFSRGARDCGSAQFYGL